MHRRASALHAKNHFCEEHAAADGSITWRLHHGCVTGWPGICEAELRTSRRTQVDRLSRPGAELGFDDRYVGSLVEADDFNESLEQLEDDYQNKLNILQEQWLKSTHK